MSYHIYLNGEKIGTSLLEKADAPIGVVFGQIIPEYQLSSALIRSYCIEHLIALQYDEYFLIETTNIPRLCVIIEAAIEIAGESTYLCGNDEEGFEVYIIGITSELFNSEFEHHRLEYDKKNPFL